MLCKEIMSRKVFTCKETDTIKACAKIMLEKNVGFLPVVGKDKKVVGVITDRDLALRAVAKNKAPSTPVSQIMTKKIIACGSDDQIGDVESRMSKHQKSRVLVLDKNQKCLGVISIVDIASFSSNSGKVLQAVTRREDRLSQFQSDKMG